MIYIVRGQKVMLDSDLAHLYQVETKQLNRQVKRNSPNVFTENGVAMLSSVINSDKAILINIAIIRIFTKLRSFLLLEQGLNEKMSKLESGTNKIFKVVFERLDNMELAVDSKLPSTKKRIGLKH